MRLSYGGRKYFLAVFPSGNTLRCCECDTRSHASSVAAGTGKDGTFEPSIPITNNMNLAEQRQEYARKTLSETDVLPDPIAQFTVWMNEAIAAQLPEPTAMT